MRPFLKTIFSEAIRLINAKVCVKVPVHHIARPFNFKMLKSAFFGDVYFYFIFVNMGSCGKKQFTQLLLCKYTTDSLPKFMYTSGEGLKEL